MTAEPLLPPTRIHRLATLIETLSHQDGFSNTAIPGLYLTKLTAPYAPRHTVNRAIFCVVAQGIKSVLLGNRRYVYGSSEYLLMSLDLPGVGEILEASPEKPLLGLSLELDFTEIGSLMLEAELPVQADPHNAKSLSVNPMTEDLLDAVLRLMDLLKHPIQIPILAPMIRREIFYKLLLGEQGELLRRMTGGNSQVKRIAAGLLWLRENAFRPIRMEELAAEVNMSPSTMHFWFKTVTTLSPLQFQKQLRLQEARRLLLSETMDAASASQQVGYESPSQFSREYRRLFGFPPQRDIERLRAAAEMSHPSTRKPDHAGSKNLLVPA